MKKTTGSLLLLLGSSLVACGSSDDAESQTASMPGSDGTMGTGSTPLVPSSTNVGGENPAGNTPTGEAPGVGGVPAAPGNTPGGTSNGAGGTNDGNPNGSGTPNGGGPTTGGATGETPTAGGANGGETSGGAAMGGGTAEGGTSGSSASGGGGVGGSGTTGGGSDCFPPITDFAVRDGGFGSAEREIVELDTGDSVSLFRPSDETFGDDCQYPLLVWGNGSTNTVDIWAGHLSRAASFGFVIVAPEQTQVTAGHMNDGLDFVLDLSEDSGSAYYGKIDSTKLGSTGYSRGGGGAMQVAANGRIAATYIWDSFGNCSALHGPVGGIFAEDGIGDGVTLIDNCSYPSFAMQAAGTNHTSVLGYPGGFGGGGSTPYSQESYVAWFRWHFMGDPAAEALFVGDACGFCTREGITVFKNGIE